MKDTATGAALAECVAPLDEDSRRAVCRYWDRVVQEEWVPRSRWEVRAVTPVEGSGRQRREARRAMARVAAAGRLAPVVALRSMPAAVGSGVAA